MAFVHQTSELERIVSATANQAIEVPSGIYIVTEHVKPLVSSDIPRDPIWGIFQIASAIEFLHTDVKAIHGLICPFAIFVTVEEGHWRLGGFDVIAPCSTFSSSPHCTMMTTAQNHPLRESGYVPPFDQLSPLGLDRWGLASLIAWVYAALKVSIERRSHLSLSPEQNLSHVPPKAQTFCKELLKSSQSTMEVLNFRKTADTNPFFCENVVLKVMLFFEQINLKGNWDKENFFSRLPDVLAQVPAQIQLHFYDQPTLLLPSILGVGEALLKEDYPNKEEIYKNRVVPVLLRLFKCPDRALRYSLLQHLSSFESFLSSSDVEEIFDSLCLGLTDTSNLLREVTLKSMVTFVPKLKKSSSIEKSMRLVTRLVQKDPEGPIRTNAVICFAKLAPAFPKNQAVEVLGPAFLGAMRDPFFPTRLAALQSVVVCVDQEIFDGQEIVTRIVPTVCQRCMDNEASIRNFAFSALEALLYKARIQLDPLCIEPNGVKNSVVTTSPSREQQECMVAVASGDVSGAPGQASDVSWAHWALKKAIDFYGSKERTEGCVASVIESVPSGNLKPQRPIPTSVTPLESRDDERSKLGHSCIRDTAEDFFDPNADNSDLVVDKWDDDFGASLQIDMVVDQTNLEGVEKKQNSISFTGKKTLSLSLTPSKKEPATFVSSTDTSNISPSCATLATELKSPNSSQIPSSNSSGLLLSNYQPSKLKSDTIVPSSGPKSSLKLRNPTELPGTKSKSVPLTDDFWNTFNMTKSGDNSLTGVDGNSAGLTDPGTKVGGAQALKKILAARKQPKEMSSDPFSNLL